MTTQEFIEKFKDRSDKEYDFFVNTSLKICDNLLIINSAVIAILVSTNSPSRFKWTLLFLFLSSICSLLSLYFQKELSRNSSIKFRTAAIITENAEENKTNLSDGDLPETESLRKQSKCISYLINASLLLFFIGFLPIILSLFLPFN